MSISTVQTGQSTYNPYAAAQRNSKQSESSPTARTATSDTVQISWEAKQLSQNPPITETPSATFDENNPPLEAFALPSWLGQYHPEATNLNMEQEDEYFAFQRKAFEDNYISDKERSKLREYTQPYFEKERFRKEFKEELIEYSTIMDSALTDAMEKNGITGDFDYYKKVTLDQTVSSEKVHQDFRKNLINSPRVTELMELLEIDDAVIEGLSINS